MAQYLIYFGYIILLSFLIFERGGCLKNIKSVSVLYILIFLAFLVSVTQFAFDVETYRKIFDMRRDPPGDWAVDLFPEYGFQLLNYFFHTILGQSFEVFRYFFSLLTMIFTLIFVKFVTNNYGIFFYLYYSKYFLIGVISHVRSSFVYPFLILSAYLFEKKQFLLIIIISLLLSQIHFSALLLNLVFLFNLVPLNGFVVALTVPLALIFKFLIFSHFQELFALIELRQLSYIEYDGDRPQSVFGVEFFKRLFVVLLIFYIVIKQNVDSVLHKLIIHFFLFSVFIYIGFGDAKFISDRVGGLFGFVEPLIFIFFFERLKKYSNKVLFFILIVLYGAVDFFLRGLVIESLPSHFNII